MISGSHVLVGCRYRASDVGHHRFLNHMKVKHAIGQLAPSIVVLVRAAAVALTS